VQIALTTKRPPPVIGDVRSLDPAVVLARAQCSLALVTMPFQDPFRPSIQLGLLKPIAESHGFPTDTFHLNLDLAAAVGESLYDVLFAGGSEQARGLGDWLFSVAAFGEEAPDRDGRFLRDCGERMGLSEQQAAALAAFRREGVGTYLDQMLNVVDWGSYRVVGFTTTFAQTVPSLALTRRLKERFPELIVVFGGSNLDGPMGVELVRSMEWIDYGITGEGDVAFTGLLVALSEGRDPSGLPGVLCRRGGAVAEPPPGAPFDRLDELPVPDYREYFDRASRLGIVGRHGRHQVWLPIEGSRGCWWGAKAHCTFCGLNGLTMTHRSKSPERVRSELAELASQTGSLRFCFVDNIVDTAYFDLLFPVLDENCVDYQLFYAVKANMTREQLRKLRDGGVRRIQPGVAERQLPALVPVLWHRGGVESHLRLPGRVAWRLSRAGNADAEARASRPARRRWAHLDGAVQPDLRRSPHLSHQMGVARGRVELHLSASGRVGPGRLHLRL
jgi:ribosomal peptide maturation radical SAM protein 1